MGNRKHQHAQHVLGSKLAAKKDLMEMLWPVLGATLLFFIPYVLLSEALGLACYGTGMQLREDLTQAQLLSYVLTFEIANLLLVQPLYFGLTQFYALRRAGGRPRLSMVTMCLASPKLYWKSVRLALLLLLFAMLWMIPTGLICAVGYVAFVSIVSTRFGWFLFIEVVIVAVAWYASVMLQYHCSYALLAEQPKLGCWKAVRMAVGKFKGHRMEAFSLLISFSFWLVMSALLGGVPLLVVLPYLLLALYHLFDRIRGVEIRVATEKTENQ